MVSFCQTIFKLSIFTCIVGIAAVELHPVAAASLANLALAETTEEKTGSQKQPANSNSDQTDLEAEILAEINRARTDPQGYAAWLQEQKQYYNGILLRLPGEKPIRTNKGLRALEEAIAFLQTQQPLTAVDSSEELSTLAATQIDNLFSTTGNKINHITYGRVTAKAIVMQLVVDDGFPSRRHRKSLFQADINHTGVSCQPDRRYSTVCAIAYEGEITEVATEPNSETAEPDPPEVIIEPESSNPEIATEPNSETTESEPAASQVSENVPTLPEPPQPPTPPNDPASETDNVESNTATEELAINETESESQDINQNASVPETDTDSEAELETELEAEAEELAATYSNQETNNNSGNIATASDSDLLEKIKQGILEEGDQIVPNDGSFYDSYPLEGKAGDSFTITLESEEFDTFVAIMDAEGNIIEQNDDINENESNSRLKVTLPSDGIYNVIVNAYDEGGKGNYVLTVSP